MKSLQTIQKTFRVFQILAKIALLLARRRSRRESCRGNEICFYKLEQNG